MKKLFYKLLGYNLGVIYNPVKQRYELIKQ